MAEILLINPNEITETTILGGNVDFDKYRFCIFDTQIKTIEPLLGSELYEYIKTNKDTLSGLYLELYNGYVKPILKFSSLATYIDIAPYMVDNGGVFKHQAESKEIVSTQEVNGLSQKYNGLADMYIIRFNKWICDNHIDEYHYSTDQNVNPNKNLRTTTGWHI